MKYKVKIIETYAYDLEIEANTPKEAKTKAKEYYDNPDNDDRCTGVADACSFEKVKFIITESEKKT